MSNGGVEGRGGKVGVTSDRGVSLPGKIREGGRKREREGENEKREN